MKSEFKPLVLIAVVLVAMMAWRSWLNLPSGALELLPPGSAQRPELTQVAGWLDDRGLSSADLAGKIVVIDCFASWCAPCEAAMPELVRDYRRYRSAGVQFIGLTSETADELEAVRDFRDRNQIEWPIAYGGQFQWQALGVETIPHLFVYDAQGDAIWTSDLPGTLDQAIQAAIERSGASDGLRDP